MYSACQVFDAWLGQEGIQGGPIHGKETLCIEQTGVSIVYEIEEVADSAEEDNEEEDIECTSQSEPRSLRQRTLLELFQPQGQEQIE